MTICSCSSLNMFFFSQLKQAHTKREGDWSWLATKQIYYSSFVLIFVVMTDTDWYTFMIYKRMKLVSHVFWKDTVLSKWVCVILPDTYNPRRIALNSQRRNFSSAFAGFQLTIDWYPLLASILYIIYIYIYVSVRRTSCNMYCKVLH